MLPNLNLDKETFKDIADSAIKSIYKYAPEWSDYNAHDPGITLIELFAFMTEAQQYHLNQLSDDMRLAYLSILGKSLNKKRSSSTVVTINPQSEDITLAKGTRLKALDIGFETDEKVSFSRRELIDGFSKVNDKIISFKNQILVDLTKLNHEIFGTKPQGFESIYLCFDKPFTKGRKESIYIDIFNEYNVKRNKITDDYVPLAKIKWEYLTDKGFVEIEEILDETHCFLYDGKISFRILEEMFEDELEEQSEGYWIRATLEESFYDVAPILSCVAMNGLDVFQQRTFSVCKDFDVSEKIEIDHFLALDGEIELYYNLSDRWYQTNDFKVEKDFNEKTVKIILSDDLMNEEIKAFRVICFDDDFSLERHLAIGDGFPYQEYTLDFKNIMAEDLSIMVENEDGGFEDYKAVDSFINSSPEDYHFMYAEDKETIYFGDCIKGFAPLGKIIITKAKESKGKLGNVNEGQITRFENFAYDATITNRKSSRGGRDTESIDDCFLRFKKSLRNIKRAVTNEDYEYLVRKTGGLMIKDCMVLPAERLIRTDGSISENNISIVVEPFSAYEKRRLTTPYIRAIMNNLDSKKLIGTNISILSPEYIGVVIIAEVEVKPYFRDAEEIIERRIKEFFEEDMSGFGKTVYYNVIYGIIDSLSCVSSINSLVLDAQGKNIRRTVNGDIKIMPNAVTYLSSSEFIITTERE